jgi:hypothetical protein
MKLEHGTKYSNGIFTYILVNVLGWWYLAYENKGIITSTIGLDEESMIKKLIYLQFKEV